MLDHDPFVFYTTPSGKSFMPKKIIINIDKKTHLFPF